MTTAPEVTPLPADGVEQAIAALRETGLRITTPRRLVLEALFAASAPVSAIELARQLSLDESSVYRNLELLEQHGVVRHVHLGHSPGLYVIANRPRTEYLHCRRCGSLTGVTPQQLDPVRELVTERFGFTPHFNHFPMVGVCATCAPLPGKSARRARDRADAAG